MPVNLALAIQLANVSALAYTDGLAAIAASPYFAGSALANNSQLQQFTVGFDSVLVGQATFGIVVSFRGTLPPDQTDPAVAISTLEDWFNDADIVLAGVPYSTGLVHSGFSDSLNKLWTGLAPAIQSAMQSGGTIYLTGHSKGGALAALAARRLEAGGIVPAGVYTFGAPRAGDETFATDYDAAMPNDWRFEHRNDIVPHLPPRPSVLEYLKWLGKFKELSTLLGTITQTLGDYTSFGNLSYLDWNDELDQDDTRLLEFEREGEMLIGGEELITDHFIDGYIAAIKAVK